MALRRPRVLSESFEQDLLEGELRPVLDLVRRDRDLIAEIRHDSMDIYFKGQRLIHLEKRRSRDGYTFIGTEKFWQEKTKAFMNREVIDEFCRTTVPMIKQRIAEHRPTGKEIEFEQMLIRATNLEKLNTDYIAIDRQSVTEAKGQTDIVGVFWPEHRSNVLKLALIEVKYGLHGGIEGIAGQIERYYKDLEGRLPVFALDLEKQLHQKARLGLIAGLSKKAEEKIQRLRISTSLQDVRVVVALVDYNPKSRRLALEQLEKLPFANQIDLFYLGFGMWRSNSQFQHKPARNRALPMGRGQDGADAVPSVVQPSGLR